MLSGSNIDTASVGTKSFSVTAADLAGNIATALYGYTVGYKVALLFDQGKAHKLGSIVPIKLQRCAANGNNESSAGAVVMANQLEKQDSTVVGTPTDAGNANPDSNFRFDTSLGGYIYNLSTKSLSAGTWVLNYTAGADPAVHTVRFDVK